jgi:hypothetical protein
MTWYFWEAIGVSADDSHITWLRIMVVKWSVLLDGKLEFIILMVCGCSWVFAYMRRGERVLLYFEQRHRVL